MPIRWFASLYSQNYQQWGKHQSHSGVPRFHPGHADTHALCTYVCVCVPVYMCMHGTMLACIHDHPCMYLCLSVCLSVYFNPPFVQAMCVCMHVSTYAGRYVGM